MWEAWLEMAEESLEAAGKLIDSAPRSSVSRYYYAAFQAVSAALIYQGLASPDNREAWTHEKTPALFIEHTKSLIADQSKRRDIAKKLFFLYKVRVSADYVSADDVQRRIKDIRKYSEYIVKVCQVLMKGGRV